MPEKEPKSDFRPADRKLVAAFLLTISAWFSHLNLSYMLVPESCENESKAVLHAITLVCLAVTAMAGVLAWRTGQAFLSQSETLPWRERTRWMSLMITALAAAVMLVIVAQEIPNLILRSCD